MRLLIHKTLGKRIRGVFAPFFKTFQDQSLSPHQEKQSFRIRAVPPDEGS